LHHPLLAHVGGVVAGSAREWRYAEQLDVLGSSCYPAWPEADAWDAIAPSAEKPLSEAQAVNHELEGLLMNFDHLRSASKTGEIWTAELQGGPIVESLRRRRVPDPADIRRWVLACLAAGVRGICFWNHRPEIFWEEGYGFSLLDWDQEVSARAQEAGRIAKALNANADLFTKGAHPDPAVAIVLNEDLYHFAEGSKREALHHLKFTIHGIWKSLWLKGVPCGFVEASAIPSDANKCKVLILPSPLALSPGVIEALQVYVRAGGTLISEACPGRFDNYGMGMKGAMMPGVAELFGAKHRGVFLIREPNKGAKWTDSNLSPRDCREFRELTGSGELAGVSIFPAYYLQTLTATTGTPILKYGDEVTGCVNQYGQGRAYLVGTLLGHGVAAYNDLHNADFLAAILGHAGVTSESIGKLKRRRRVLGNQTAWFLFNTSGDPMEETVSMAGFRSATDLLGENIANRGGKLTVRIAPFDVRCLLLES
jgi:beta-galactosidase